MSEDHLSNETSLSAAITDTGVTAAAKSRTVAAIDRLVGNIADLPSAWLEGINVRKRAKTEGERQLIEAAAQYGIARMGQDNEFAERAYGNHFRKVASQQLNKDAVVAEALNDLRSQPVDIQSSGDNGPDALSEEFMDRFERYAEGATTEQLRERWGRILAGEIRRPGTFTLKTLRTTDELDSSTARLFEDLMVYRSADMLIKPLMGSEIPFHNLLKLVGSGLVVDPGSTGHLWQAFDGNNGRGEEFWLFPVGEIHIGFKKDTTVEYDDRIIQRNDKPSIPIYILTDAGAALASIIVKNNQDVARSFF